jgi:hypothetical protein
LSVKIHIEDLTDDRVMRRACDMTRKPGVKPSTITRAKLLRCEHSPVRLINFWIELIGIPSFVSTHLVRHKFGVEHFVESNRDDRGGAGDEAVNRLTPVNHGLLVNAQALIAMSRKRLCYASHTKTVAVWSRLRKAMKKVCPDMAEALVPECVYRGSFCPELRECKPGLEKVVAIYRKEQA